MDFVFQGFQSALPFWFYLLLIAATAGLAWWSYKEIKTLNPLYRYLLITLRALSFLILLILLLNPFFKSDAIKYEKPEVLVLLDNSASISVEKGSYEGVDSYLQTLTELNFPGIGDRLNFRYFAMDGSVSTTHPDSLTFDGSETNLYNAVEVIRNNERDARAAVLMSDGIFNSGRTPLFLSRELQTPVFTVALGDTSRLRDLVVRNVVTNAIGYVNTTHPVEVEILSRGFNRQPFDVQLQSGDDLLDTRTIEPASPTSSHSVTFQLKPEEEGLKQYRVLIPAKEGEWTVANNTQPVSIEVLDDKQSILSLALQIHPDVRMVRSLLEQDENSLLSTRTWLGGNRFIGGSLDVDPDTLDLLVLHGYPARGISASWDARLVELLGTVPSVLLSSPENGLPNLPGAETLLPITQTTSASPLQVNLVPVVESTEHPVMELPEVSYDRLPPVYSPIRGLRISPGSTVLFNSSYQGSATDQPLIAVKETGNLRKSQLNGFDWYRIAQNPNPRARAFIETLIYNLVSWTAERPDNRRLKLEPVQKTFTGNETVAFNAFLTNESGEVETDGVISVTISGEGIESRLYNMTNTGGGQYRLQIGTLPEGIYRFQATATKGNRTIDTQSGEFSISGSNIEFVNTTRNDHLLRQISGTTGGRFYTYGDVNTLWQEMDEMGLLDREETVISELFYPYQHVFWFVLVIIFLGAEWLLRKYAALP